MQSINKLSDRLAQRIAAGEVVERPESILREFIDNSIDAQSSEIIIEIENGGIDCVLVRDDGKGISREDLNVIANRHATSKIKNEDDLYNIRTLGFRGEALYSISSVSKLTILSHDRENGDANKLVIDNGERKDIEKAALEKGTVIKAEDLFLDIPARRQFLKKASTEANACKNLVIARALANPSIAFKFYSDGALKLNFEKAESLKERIMMYYRPLGIESADVMHLKGSDEDYSIDIVATTSARRRSDRKEIRIYVNGRPVDEYSLMQAVSYGYGELLPGGSFPYAAVFINDKAELVDFNIHPAKKEVKIRNINDIHHAIVLLLKNGIERKIPEIKAEEDNSTLFKDDEWQSLSSRSARRETGNDYSYGSFKRAELKVSDKSYNYDKTDRPKDSSWIEKAKEIRREREERERLSIENAVKEVKKEKEVVPPLFHYIGQAFNLFLIAEKDDELYFVDQHAAHERIIYDELLEKKSVQRLLVPIELDTEEDVSIFLDKSKDIYSRLGIELEKKDGKWFIVSLPSVAREIEKEVAAFISLNTGDEKELEMNIFAIIACKSAVKAGDELDRFSAEAILEKVFVMKEPACPHGRTFLIKLKEKDLRLMVGRTS